LIKEAWGKDISMMMVTQEILIYLSILISTEPELFEGMIRLRIGLIIQVMVGELKRTLCCTGFLKEQLISFLNVKITF
jgi:phosphorylase kinase alpha/beta subunit